MANNPATRNVVKFKGSGNPQVHPNLPTQVNGDQTGADVGTGGSPATLETPPSGAFVCNRNIEFLNDRYVLMGDSLSPSNGAYKKDQGGADQWGRVTGGGYAYSGDSRCSGLHVLHPAGVPTMAFLAFDSGHEMRLNSTVTGTSGANWGITAGQLIETNGLSPAATGQSIVFRDSIVWAHSRFTGGAGIGEVTQFDLVTQTLTRYAVTGIHASLVASAHALHVHENVLFLFSFADAPGGLATVWKLTGGSFVAIYTSSAPAQYYQAPTTTTGHTAMFTDAATGDLILVMSERNDIGFGTQVVRIQDATTSPAGSDITSATMQSGEGADKYLAGNPSGDFQRRWSVYVDVITDPDNPRTFLTTWSPGGGTETWEWKGIAAEMELVANGQGISDDYALPYDTVGNAARSPRSAAIEIGDASNPPEEVTGGTKFFFRGQGSAPVGVVTFRGSDDEGSPSTIIPIIAASLTVESGSPPTTPAISTNTLTNFTPDNGATLYSVELAVGAAGVDITAGDVGLIIPYFV